MKKTQIKSSEKWLIIFTGISFSVLLLRSFVFSKLEKIQHLYFSSELNMISIFVLIVLIFSVVVSVFVLYFISLEVKKEKKISKEFRIKNLKEVFNSCIKYDSFRALLYFNLFIIFINSFLSVFFERKAYLALSGFFGFVFMVITSLIVIFFIFLGFLIATKGINKSIFLKILLLILVIIISFIISFFSIKLCILILI